MSKLHGCRFAHFLPIKLPLKITSSVIKLKYPKIKMRFYVGKKARKMIREITSI